MQTIEVGIKPRVVEAVVVFPVNVRLSIENESRDEIWDQLILEAERQVRSDHIAPVMVSCSEEGVIVQGNESIPRTPDSQSDWTLKALQHLQQMEHNLEVALIARPLLRSQSVADQMTRLKGELASLLKDFVASISPAV